MSVLAQGLAPRPPATRFSAVSAAATFGSPRSGPARIQLVQFPRVETPTAATFDLRTANCALPLRLRQPTFLRRTAFRFDPSQLLFRMRQCRFRSRNLRLVLITPARFQLRPVSPRRAPHRRDVRSPQGGTARCRFASASRRSSAARRSASIRASSTSACVSAVSATATFGSSDHASPDPRHPVSPRRDPHRRDVSARRPPRRRRSSCSAAPT